MPESSFKIIENDIGVNLNVDIQNEIKNERIEFDRIRQNLHEIENEISTQNNNNK